MAEHFGSKLAEARKRRGLSFDQVHSQLRITPAILESLEHADFYHMPLKGHARNMVSSYARFLGLDPNELTKQFLKEYHDFENHMARRESSPSSFPGYRAGTATSGNIESRPSSVRRSARGEVNQGFGSMWNKPIPKSELGRGYDSNSLYVESGFDYNQNEYSDKGASEYGSQRRDYSSRATNASGYSATRKSERGFVNGNIRRAYPENSLESGVYYQQDSRGLSSPRQRVDGREASRGFEAFKKNPKSVGRRVDSSHSVGSYSTKPSLPFRLLGSLFNNPIALIIVLIVVLILLFAVWAIAANSCKAEEEITPTPVVAGSVVTGDTTAPVEGTDTNAPSTTEPVNTGFTLVVTPKSGSEPWTKVTVDGTVVFEENFFREEKTWEVKQSCIVWTAQVANLTVKKNGETVTLENDPSTGFSSITINASDAASTSGTGTGTSDNSNNNSSTSSNGGSNTGTNTDNSTNTGNANNASSGSSNTANAGTSANTSGNTSGSNAAANTTGNTANNTSGSNYASTTGNNNGSGSSYTATASR